LWIFISAEKLTRGQIFSPEFGQNLIQKQRKKNFLSQHGQNLGLSTLWSFKTQYF
jgi:hypothetical protein